jgi:4-diphosphocytidyl-2-C-methyl-D-erythritol kinase
MATCVRSFSKINLGLVIGPPRADGFHGLTTLYQTLEAHDLVTVSAERMAPGAADRITITSNDRRVPVDERNTVWKMVDRTLRSHSYAVAPHLGMKREGWAVSIHIEKRLPMRAGLGAGSANAAAALIGLEHETGLVLGGSERLEIAAAVGSDVPLFLLGGAVLGTGRGEQVAPVPDLLPNASEYEVVVALPHVGVSTPQAFRDWDAAAPEPGPPADFPLTGLTAQEPSARLTELSRALALALCEPHYSSGVFPPNSRGGLARHPLAALVRTGIRNDFEEVVFRQHPFLGTIKRTLEVPAPPGSPPQTDYAPLYAALSGSGSALFALYAGGEAAEAAQARLRALGVNSLRTRLLGREQYWKQMVFPAQDVPAQDSVQ